MMFDDRVTTPVLLAITIVCDVGLIVCLVLLARLAGVA